MALGKGSERGVRGCGVGRVAECQGEGVRDRSHVLTFIVRDPVPSVTPKPPHLRIMSCASSQHEMASLTAPCTTATPVSGSCLMGFLSSILLPPRRHASRSLGGGWGERQWVE